MTRLPVRAASALLAALPLLLAPAAAPAQAQKFRLEMEGAVRVGLYDPHPRLCDGSERTQRDLLVGRLAFALHTDPAARRQPPWYLELGAEENGAVTLRLRSEALWGVPPAWLAPAEAAGAGDPLAQWRRALAETLGMARVDPGAEPGLLRLSGQPGPFAWSRLHGSAAFPRVAGWRASAMGEDCPAFPQGVWLEPAEGTLRYTLTVSRPDRGPPFVLSGYADEAALWRDFRRGRLDAVWVEGDDVTAADLPDDPRIVWGAEAGTQQILIRPAPRLLEELGPQRWAALSEALPRGDLARLYGPGRIVPARGFLTPLLGRRGAPPAVLQENPRDARRIWLGTPSPRARITLATIANPVLEAMARRIGEHFQRTLNLKTTVVPIPVDGFADSLAAREHDLYLTVADLDDGSLQDLWDETLSALDAYGKTGQGPALTEKRLAAWERALEKARPYLPLAENVHFAVARDAAFLRAICPACEVPVRAPERGPPTLTPAPAEPVVPPEG